MQRDWRSKRVAGSEQRRRTLPSPGKVLFTVSWPFNFELCSPANTSLSIFTGVYFLPSISQLSPPWISGENKNLLNYSMIQPGPALAVVTIFQRKNVWLWMTFWLSSKLEIWEFDLILHWDLFTLTRASTAVSFLKSGCLSFYTGSGWCNTLPHSSRCLRWRQAVFSKAGYFLLAAICCFRLAFLLALVD